MNSSPLCMIDSFWTNRQRQSNKIHQISYRACFKPELVSYFIERYSSPEAIVYDPFMGRGTTLIEAHLKKRIPYGNDINPISRVLTEPRLNPPTTHEVQERLMCIPLNDHYIENEDLLAFYHKDTLKQIESIRAYFLSRNLDKVDKWIQMVVANRLTGHSSGFLSVFTLPPNQATSIKQQLKINKKYKQVPPKRDLIAIVLKKSRALLSEYNYELPVSDYVLLTQNSIDTPQIKDNTVSLTITSPPFLDEVNYADDNWLRGWFIGIDTKSIRIDMHKDTSGWERFISATLAELYRITKPKGYVVMEVGEVKNGSIQLEEHVLKAVEAIPFIPLDVLINSQKFTKTSNCWGVKNNSNGTNTNRIIVFQKA